MKLNFIETEKCPVCGCNMVVLEKIDIKPREAKNTEHETKYTYEHRQFACGCTVVYSPVAKKEEITKNVLLTLKKSKKKRNVQKQESYCSKK